ncbi:MAG: segregation/condensation protein A [Thermodesulfobacteriota bacterium]|nr:segregation/condensation protein A [Thermodesulfobacteriota bacterium]
MQMEQPYQIRTEIFEGPMDLLVHLIKKNAVSIYDIPIAAITKQFLDYIEWMKMLNIDFAGDFLYMAAILTSIKSRTLLPAHGKQDDEDDPRLEITQALEEYLKIKSAADDLSAREILNEDTFTRAAEKKPDPAENDDEMISVGLFELIDAFQNILDRIPASSSLRFSADEISVKDKISEIVDILENRRSITFYELFAREAGKSEIVATFLAILEMVKLNLVELKQHTQSGMIRLFYR